MKEIRRLTGITQEKLANFLRVPRSQVAAAETGNRSLPSAAAIKAAEMVVMLHSRQSVPQMAEEDQAQNQDFQEKITARLKECIYQLDLARRKWETIQQQYEECHYALLLVNELSPTIPAGKQGKPDRLWLEILQDETMDKLKNCGMEAQGLLQLQMEMLELEEGKLRGLMYNNSTI